MRYWLIGILALFVCSCHGTRAYAPSKTAQAVMAPGANFILTAGDRSYVVSHHIPAEWASVPVETATEKDFSYAVYRRPDNGDTLIVGALNISCTPYQLTNNHVVKTEKLTGFRFGQILTTADRSESYVAYDSAQRGLSGAVLYRTQPGLSGVALNAWVIRRSLGGNTTVENIALVTRVARSLMVSPVIK